MRAIAARPQAGTTDAIEFDVADFAVNIGDSSGHLLPIRRRLLPPPRARLEVGAVLYRSSGI